MEFGCGSCFSLQIESLQHPHRHDPRFRSRDRRFSPKQTEKNALALFDACRLKFSLLQKSSRS